MSEPTPAQIHAAVLEDGQGSSATPFTLVWYTSWLVMGAVQIAGGLIAAVATNDQALFTHAEDLRAAVMASDTPASIDISTGWPATFGE